MLYKLNPIPPTHAINGWQSAPIVENNEPLIDVTSFAPDKIVSNSKYYERQIPGSMSICYVRKTVGQLLAQASRQLPEGWKFVIFDAWRPIEVQEFLYNEFIVNLRKLHPNWTSQEIINYAQIYVSLANDTQDSPSPHLTGGAIDLSIIDKDGNFLDMGTEYDEMTEKARTNYFENTSDESDHVIECKQRDNRRLLYNLLTKQGLTNYPEEWWHFDYGNQFWAILTGSQATYSKTKPK